MIKLEWIEKAYEDLLVRLNANEDRLDQFFSQEDFTESGGITPLQFQHKYFMEFMKEDKALRGYDEELIQLGILYTLIYNDTDFKGENSTMGIVRECDNCTNEEKMIYKDLPNEEYKCPICGESDYTITKDYS